MAETYFIAALYATIVFGMIMMTEAAEGKAGLATNSIFFCYLFVKNHCFADSANQSTLNETLLYFVPPSNSLGSVLDP